MRSVVCGRIEGGEWSVVCERGDEWQRRSDTVELHKVKRSH